MKGILVTGLLVASAPAASDTFAIACTGDTLSTGMTNGEVTTEIFSLPDQVFVFDERSRVALRAMPLMQMSEGICQIGPDGRQLRFSADQIGAYWVSGSDWDAKTTCEFVYDRISGIANLRIEYEWSDRNRRKTDWRMVCSPTQVPSFVSEDN